MDRLEYKVYQNLANAEERAIYIKENVDIVRDEEADLKSSCWRRSRGFHMLMVALEYLTRYGMAGGHFWVIRKSQQMDVIKVSC
jgi:hypothetical protein